MSCHVFFFRLNTLKGTVKTPAVDILRLNTLTGSIQNYFLTPEKCDEHPCPFRMGVPRGFLCTSASSCVTKNKTVKGLVEIQRDITFLSR